MVFNSVWYPVHQTFLMLLNTLFKSFTIYILDIFLQTNHVCKMHHVLNIDILTTYSIELYLSRTICWKQFTSNMVNISVFTAYSKVQYTKTWNVAVPFFTKKYEHSPLYFLKKYRSRTSILVNHQNWLIDTWTIHRYIALFWYI